MTSLNGHPVLWLYFQESGEAIKMPVDECPCQSSDVLPTIVGPLLRARVTLAHVSAEAVPHPSEMTSLQEEGTFPRGRAESGCAEDRTWSRPSSSHPDPHPPFFVKLSALGAQTSGEGLLISYLLHVWICIKITLYNEIYNRVILAVYLYILALDTVFFGQN